MLRVESTYWVDLPTGMGADKSTSESLLGEIQSSVGLPNSGIVLKDAYHWEATAMKPVPCSSWGFALPDLCGEA